MAVAVSPEGSVSTTVTVLLVGAEPLFDTVIVYCALVWPWVKSPVWLFTIVKSGTITVCGSPAERLPLKLLSPA